MSSGTINERILQNDNLLEENNINLQEVRELANSLPDKSSDVINDTNGTLDNPVEGTTREFTGLKSLFVNTVNVGDILFFKNTDSVGTNPSKVNQIIVCKVLSVEETTEQSIEYYNLSLKILKYFSYISDTQDSTATINDILFGKIAYSQGKKLLGTYRETGVDTSDATATPSDIATSKTAYARGQKIVGTLPITVGFTGGKVNTKEDLINNYGLRRSIEYFSDRNLLSLAFQHQEDELKKKDSITYIEATPNVIANEINLTPDVIKKDVTIMNITGTYEGSGGNMKVYSTVTEMKADISNIAEGELVKVTSSSTPRYFIKRTTMIELVIPETQEYYDVYWE